MTKKNTGLVGFLAAAIIIATVFFFQNCAEVQYVKPNSDNTVEAVGNETSVRYVYLKPVATSVIPSAPFKVLLVIDDSGSMVQTNEKLKNSIQSLLAPLHQYPVLLKIITTSRLVQSNIINQRGWSYKTTTLSPSVSPADSLKQKFNFVDGEVFASGYDIFYSLNQVDLYSILANDPDLDIKVDQIKNRIIQISSSGSGDHREQGLCNALLALYDEGPYRIFQPGDKAAIVVLSDENDSSIWNPHGSNIRSYCHNRYTYGRIGNPNLPYIESAHYNLNTWNVRFSVSFDKVQDGVRTPGTSTNDNGGLGLSYSTEANFVSGKSATDIIACEERHLTSALNYARYLFPPPLYDNVQISKCEIKASWTALYSFGETNEDRCVQSFSENEINYLDMADYYQKEKNRILVNGSCKRHIQRTMSGRNFGDFYIHNATDSEIVSKPSNSSLPQQPMIQKALVNRALELFGKNGFSFTSIVHKTSECIPSPNQSVGTAYMNTGEDTELAHAFKSVSICEEDFNPILGQLANHIITIIGAEMTLPKLLEGESVQKATILRGESRINLNSTDYNLEPKSDGTQIMRVNSALLIHGDIIEVMIVRNNAL